MPKGRETIRGGEEEIELLEIEERKILQIYLVRRSLVISVYDDDIEKSPIWIASRDLALFLDLFSFASGVRVILLMQVIYHETQTHMALFLDTAKSTVNIHSIKYKAVFFSYEIISAALGTCELKGMKLNYRNLQGYEKNVGCRKSSIAGLKNGILNVFYIYLEAHGMFKRKLATTISYQILILLGT